MNFVEWYNTWLEQSKSFVGTTINTMTATEFQSYMYKAWQAGYEQGYDNGFNSPLHDTTPQS